MRSRRTLEGLVALFALGLVLVVGLLLAFGLVGGEDEPGQAPRALVAGPTMIGYQNGCSSAAARLRRLDPGGTNASGTGAWDKLERTCLILVRDHDAGISPPPPPTTTTVPPTTTTTPSASYAPQSYNRGTRGQDARYCVEWPGVERLGPNLYRDGKGVRYDAGGLELDGNRSGNPVDGLKPSDSMDGRGPCEPDGAGHPPYPPGSFAR